jgi:tetratricopeptide (TPR) repeat protein
MLCPERLFRRFLRSRVPAAAFAVALLLGAASHAAAQPSAEPEGAEPGPVAPDVAAADPVAAYEQLVASIPADVDPAVRSYLMAMAAMAVADHETALTAHRRAVELALEAPTEPSRIAALAAMLSLRGALGWAPREWIAPVVELLDRVPLPDADWLPVLGQFYGLLGEMHYDDADIDAARRDAAARGCLVEWTGTGPEGPTAYVDWAREPPEGFWLHPAAWGVGQNRPAEPEQSWHPEVYLCNLTLGRVTESRPGVMRLSAVVDFPAGLRTTVLHVTVTDPFLLRIDGTEVLRHDPLREAIGNVFDVEIVAPPGRHRIDFQLASGWGRPSLSVSLLGIDDSGRPVPLVSSADLSTETPPAFLGEARELAVRPRDEWTALVALDVLEGGSRNEAAARGAEQLADSAWGEGNALAQLRAGSAVLRDPTLSLPEARRRASDRFERLGDLANSLLPPLAARAGWALEDGDLDDAIPLLRAARTIFPADPGLLQQLAGAYSSRSWIEEARQVIESLEAAMPGSCSVKRMRLSFAYELGETAAIGEAVEEVLRCNPAAFDRIGVLNRAQQWDRVVAEIERLRPLYGDPDQPDTAIAMARLQAGDTTGLEELLRARLEKYPDNESYLGLLVDLLLRAGRRDEAIALLEDAVSFAQPTNSSAVESVAAMEGFDPYSSLYIPAPLAIAAYEARRGEQEAPATQVLDHTVSRILDDGTIRMVTHTILKLSSQEAIEAYGQSGGGGALAARTIAPDGSATNVVNIAQAGVGSFPNLTPGCYIETFNARVDPPSPLLQGGTDHWRFYFQSADETMARTEFVLVSPTDYELDFSPRADPPNPSQEELDVLRLRRWAGHDVQPLRVEPMAVQSDEYVPSVRAARNYRWDRLIAGLADAMYAGDYVPLEVADFAHTTCDGLDENGCTRALYEWILENVEPGDFGESVAATYQRRAGSRSRLIVALLRAAGFSPRLLLATSIDRDQTESPIAEAGRYYYPVVEAAGTYFTIEADEAPFGFLPAEIRGMPAALYDPAGMDGLETVTLPERPELQEGFVARLDLQIDPEGGDVKVEAEIEVTGGFAAELRDGLLQRSPADREGDLTGIFVAPSFPGADVESITIEGLDDREAPLLVRFIASAQGLTVRRGGTLLLPPPVPQSISSGYAPLPSIEHPAVVMPPLRIDLQLRIHAAGWRVGGLSGQGVEADGVRFTQESTDEGDGGTLRRVLDISRLRLAPDAYPPFAQAIRRAENLWNMPVELRQAR